MNVDQLLTDPDPCTLLVAADWCEEEGRSDEAHYLRSLWETSMLKPPFEVGQSWFLCTVTLYYVGRVAELGLGWLRLEEASWVHWTGRLSTLLSVQQWTHRDFQGRSPRVEPCGEVVLSTQSLVSAYPWRGPLTREPIE